MMRHLLVDAAAIKLKFKDMKNYSVMAGTDVERLDKALGMLDRSVGELHRAANRMISESLMRFGLRTSLEDFCNAIPGAKFRYLGEDPRLAGNLEVFIYRCARELVDNAVKHADAATINVQLMIDNGLVSLTVHDDGAGFDPETVVFGSGLEDIRTSVSDHNGKMHILSSPGNGTEVSIEIEKRGK